MASQWGALMNSLTSPAAATLCWDAQYISVGDAKQGNVLAQQGRLTPQRLLTRETERSPVPLNGRVVARKALRNSFIYQECIFLASPLFSSLLFSSLLFSPSPFLSSLASPIGLCGERLPFGSWAQVMNLTKWPEYKQALFSFVRVEIFC